MTSVTVMVPITIRRRGGRKRIIGPDGTPVRTGQESQGVDTTNGDPALVKALARAFRWRRMLEDGRYASIRELAAAEGADRSYVARMLRMTLLAPDVVEAILDGREPSAPVPPALRGHKPECFVWQQAALRTGQAPYPARQLPGSRETEVG